MMTPGSGHLIKIRRVPPLTVVCVKDSPLNMEKSSEFQISEKNIRFPRLLKLIDF